RAVRHPRRLPLPAHPPGCGRRPGDPGDGAVAQGTGRPHGVGGRFEDHLGPAAPEGLTQSCHLTRGERPAPLGCRTARPMRPRLVTKFGGTSLATREAWLQTLSVIESRRDKNPLVVVSAVGSVPGRHKVTDLLLEM